jgi:putative copper export protein
VAPLTVENRPCPDRSPGPAATGRTQPVPPVPAPAASSRAGWVRWVWAPAGLLFTGVFMVALLFGAGGPPPPLPGLPDAGPVTGWGRPLVDLLVRLLAVLTVGQLAYVALLAPSCAAPGTARALRGSAWSAAGWLVAEGAALVLTASSLYAVPVTGLSPQGVLAVATEFPAGRAAVCVALLLAVVVIGSARLVRGTGLRHRDKARTASVVLLLTALGSVVLPGVLAGHSAAADDHVPAVLALSIHVVTASLWVGGLTGLLLHGRDRTQAVHAVRRFSALALLCVLLLTASGAVAAVLVAGPPTLSWAGQGWVVLLGLKTVLLVALTAIGWWHRRRTLPALAAGKPQAFLRFGVGEVALMILTLTLSVALAASPSPTPAEADGSSSGAPAPVVSEGPQGAALDGDAPEDDLGQVPPGDDAPASTLQEPLENMSGHDHGELSVSILVDDDRFHVTSTVRSGQPVTVYNQGSSAATITALDGSFDADVGPRTFITFIAPDEPGDYDFISRPQGIATDGFIDTLHVRAEP